MHGGRAQALQRVIEYKAEYERQHPLSTPGRSAPTVSYQATAEQQDAGISGVSETVHIRVVRRMWYDVLIVLVGYGFSIFVGHWLIRTLVMGLWIGLGWRQNADAEYLFRLPALPAMVGILERTLYTTAMLIGQPGFIGFWLALKVAGGWKGWSEPVRTLDGKVIINGRDFFSVFLIGSGFSIAYAVSGALLIEWWKNGDLAAAVGVPVLLVLGTLGYIAWGRRLAR